jgi:hypothetical protein
MDAAAYIPAIKEHYYLMILQGGNRMCDKSWDDITYKSIDWHHNGESFKNLSNG